jgi:phospholipase/carboxylesterase
MLASLDLPLRHRFVPGSDPAARPLLLLHGTGGNEDDLLPLGRTIAPGAALLSPRGAVEENGMPRFFRRLAEGVFDEVDLRRRTAELAEFIAAARARYGIAAPLAVGFSNGANIAAALLMLQPGVLAGAVLLRAMVPFRQPPTATLAGTPVLLLSGSADPIVPADNSARLAAQLQAAGAEVTHRTLPGGHGLTQSDIQAVTAWLEGHAR